MKLRGVIYVTLLLLTTELTFSMDGLPGSPPFFTNPKPGVDWTDYKYANEFVTSYVEHVAVLGWSTNGINAFQSGDDATHCHFWSNMQVWVSNNYTRFVNDSLGPNQGDFAGRMPSELIPNYQSWSNFVMNAGLSYYADPLSGEFQGGFRRCWDWWQSSMDPSSNNWRDVSVWNPMWRGNRGTFGFIQPGDIRGPWVDQDLHQAWNALKWTQMQSVTTTNSWYAYYGNWYWQDAGSDPKPTWGDAVDQFQEDWPVNVSWAGPYASGMFAYRVMASGYYSIDIYDRFFWSLSGERWKGQYGILNLPTVLPRTAELYILPQNLDCWDTSSGIPWIQQTAPSYLGREHFYDVDGPADLNRHSPVMVDTNLWFAEVFAETTNATYTSAIYGDFLGCPILDNHPDPSITPYWMWNRNLDANGCEAWKETYPADMNYTYWVLKWHWTFTWDGWQ